MGGAPHLHSSVTGLLWTSAGGGLLLWAASHSAVSAVAVAASVAPTRSADVITWPHMESVSVWPPAAEGDSRNPPAGAVNVTVRLSGRRRGGAAAAAARGVVGTGEAAQGDVQSLAPLRGAGREERLPAHGLPVCASSNSPMPMPSPDPISLTLSLFLRDRDGAVKALSLPSQPVAMAALLSALTCGAGAGAEAEAGAGAVLLKALQRATQLDDAAADVVLGMLLKR